MVDKPIIQSTPKQFPSSSPAPATKLYSRWWFTVSLVMLTVALIAWQFMDFIGPFIGVVFGLFTPLIFLKQFHINKNRVTKVVWVIIIFLGVFFTVHAVRAVVAADSFGKLLDCNFKGGTYYKNSGLVDETYFCARGVATDRGQTCRKSSECQGYCKYAYDQLSFDMSGSCTPYRIVIQGDGPPAIEEYDQFLQ